MAIAAAELAEGAAGGGAAGAAEGGASRIFVKGRPVDVSGWSPSARAAIQRHQAAQRPPAAPRAGKRASQIASKPSKATPATLSTQPAPRRASRSSSGPSLPSLGDVPGRIPAASTAGTKLITALFVGILVLEVLSYVTGQYFSFDWTQLGNSPKVPPGTQKGYVPLFGGPDFHNVAPVASSAGAAAAAAAGAATKSAGGLAGSAGQLGTGAAGVLKSIYTGTLP